MLSPIRSHPCEESKSCGDAASPRSGLSEGKESGFETANFEPNETEAHLIMEEEIEQMRQRVLAAVGEESSKKKKYRLSAEKQGKAGEKKRGRKGLQGSDKAVKRRERSLAALDKENINSCNVPLVHAFEVCELFA